VQSDLFLGVSTAVFFDHQGGPGWDEQVTFLFPAKVTFSLTVLPFLFFFFFPLPTGQGCAFFSVTLIHPLFSKVFPFFR